jgi:hypothetical protein
MEVRRRSAMRDLSPKAAPGQKQANPLRSHFVALHTPDFQVFPDFFCTGRVVDEDHLIASPDADRGNGPAQHCRAAGVAARVALVG